MSRDTRLLELGQLALPLVLLTLGVLELGALGLTVVRAADATGIALAAGPGALVPVTLAVVFATLLRPTSRAVRVRAITAVGAAVFLLARLGLVATAVLSGGPALPAASMLGAASGLVLGLSLAVWSAIEFRAAQLCLRPVAPPSRQQPAAEPARPSPVDVPNPQTITSPGPRPRVTAPRPRAALTPHPVSQATPPARFPERTSPGAVPWHRGSTPWPRGNEDDPDGTLLRPPRRR